MKGFIYERIFISALSVIAKQGSQPNHLSVKGLVKQITVYPCH